VLLANAVPLDQTSLHSIQTLGAHGDTRKSGSTAANTPKNFPPGNNKNNNNSRSLDRSFRSSYWHIPDALRDTPRLSTNVAVERSVRGARQGDETLFKCCPIYDTFRSTVIRGHPGTSGDIWGHPGSTSFCFFCLRRSSWHHRHRAVWLNKRYCGWRMANGERRTANGERRRTIIQESHFLWFCFCHILFFQW
jgi:hypothetical protein